MRFRRIDPRLGANAAALMLAIAFAVLPHATLAAGEIRILVQSSPLAGFRYYTADAHWQDMKEGDALTLVREADNPHDSNAIRVEWKGSKLGYLPRRENRAVAAAMDAGDTVDARIAKLREHRDPWQRVLIDVHIVL